MTRARLDFDTDGWSVKGWDGVRSLQNFLEGGLNWGAEEVLEVLGSVPSFLLSYTSGLKLKPVVVSA